MPRGFLVKRRGFLVKRYNKIPSSASPESLGQRVRRYSDEDRSDSSSDHDIGDGLLFLHNSNRPSESTTSSLVINHDSDTNSPSPPLVGHHKAEDEPLSHTLTTANDTVSRCQSPNYPISHSVVYFPRLDKSIPSTPPRQKSASSRAPPLTAPYPPKKRATDPSIKNDKINSERSTAVVPDVKPKPPKRAKVIRKLNFDEDKSSPVSGTFIRDLDSDDDMMMPSVKRGDIDPSLNLVVVTEEARAELKKIPNLIGDYVCQLCKQHYPDAFGLAQHRCSRIVHVEYRCPECDKVFNCPANLASHRRWHKPRPTTSNGTKTPSSPPRLLPNNTKNSVCDPKPENRGSELTPRRESYNSDVSDSESLRDSPSPGVSGDVNESFYTGTDPERLDCETCGKKFALQQHLNEHILTHNTYSDAHEKEDNSRDMCGNVSKRSTLRVSPISSDLEDLMDNNHSCPSCAASFSGHHELEKHMLIHHAAEGITCKYCPCTFFSSAGLTRHINKYHPSKNHQVILLQIPTVRPVTT